MFHPYHWWRLGPTLDPFPKNFGEFYTPEIQHRYQKWPYSKPQSTSSFQAPIILGPSSHPSFVFSAGEKNVPSPTMGIQERFDEICEKYELRDGDAAGEAWGFGVLWMGVGAAVDFVVCLRCGC